MVGVAQLVEPWIVIPVVVGSIPIAHPSSEYVIRFVPYNRASMIRRYSVWVLHEKWQIDKMRALSGPLAQLVEQLTLNQRVVGSIPTRPTRQLK